MQTADTLSGGSARAGQRKAAVVRNAQTQRRALGLTPGYRASSAPAPKPKSQAAQDAEWLKTDADYTSAQALANKAKSRFTTGQQTARDQYERDYGKAAQTLGFDPATGTWAADVGEGRRSGYNRATQGTAGNFAARGMLQGSDYVKADDDVRAEFNQRQSDMLQGKADFTTQQQQDLSGFQEQQQAVLDQARREALARRVAAERSGLFL